MGLSIAPALDYCYFRRFYRVSAGRAAALKVVLFTRSCDTRDQAVLSSDLLNLETEQQLSNYELNARQGL